MQATKGFILFILIMRYYILLAFLAAFLFCPKISFAQVTIGSNEAPVGGALLQLKNKAAAADGSNATKGLMMPRVQLASMDSLKPMYSYVDVANTPTANDLIEHAGLMVYNIPNDQYCPCVQGGMYVWSGEKWEPLSSQPILGTVTGKSGAVYKTRQFGEAGEWMIENLRETEYETGQADALTIERLVNPNNTAPNSANYNKKVYYFPSNVAYNNVVSHDRALFDAHPNYGLLYSWAGATNGQPSDIIAPNVAGTTRSNIQGICPAGWRLPSDYDWTQLEKEIFTHPTLYSNSSAGTTPWNPAWDAIYNAARPTTDLPNAQGRSMKSCELVYNSTVPQTRGSSLPSGFSALLVGHSVADAVPQNPGGYGTYAVFWSATRTNDTVLPTTEGFRAFARSMVVLGPGVTRDPGTIAGNMYSVRCVK